MSSPQPMMFDCQMYVPQNGPIVQVLPFESGPQRAVAFMPIAYTALVDPGFRRLLTALETLPQSARPFSQSS